MNRIPRRFDHMIIEALLDGMAGKKGDRYEVTKNEWGYHGKNLTTGETWHMFPGHIRNENLYRIVEVI